MASIYRKAAWLALGMTNFTRQAYQKHAAHFTDDIQSINLSSINQSPKVAMITGANSGLGYEMAKTWFNQGGIVHMVCRNKDRAEQAKQKIIDQYQSINQSSDQATNQLSSLAITQPDAEPTNDQSINQPINPSDRIFVHIVDLSSIKEIKSFARAWCSSHQPINVLINNAGAMIHKTSIDQPPLSTPEGLECNFSLNVAGQFVLTRELLPVLRESNSAGFLSRVVTMSSGGALVSDLLLDDLQCQKHGWEGTDATFVYAHNKRCAISLTEEFDRREQLHAGEYVPRVTFHVCHPGWSDTEGVQQAMPDFHAKLAGKWRSPAEGVDTALWLSMSPSASQFPPHIPSGKFWFDREPVRSTLFGARYVGVDAKSSEMLYNKLQDMTASIEPFEYDLMHRYDYLAPATPSARSRANSQNSKSNSKSENHLIKSDSTEQI